VSLLLDLACHYSSTSHSFAIIRSRAQGNSQQVLIVSDQDNLLQRIFLANGWFMSLLRAARAVDLPDWFVGAGVIRNIVWDHLLGYAIPTPPADVDVVFFDPHDLSAARDAAAEAQ
jgi:hypothetical protein